MTDQNPEACPRDLPEQGVQPMITVTTSGQQGEPRVDEQHPTDQAAQ